MEFNRVGVCVHHKIKAQKIPSGRGLHLDHVFGEKPVGKGYTRPYSLFPPTSPAPRCHVHAFLVGLPPSFPAELPGGESRAGAVFPAIRLRDSHEQKLHNGHARHHTSDTTLRKVAESGSRRSRGTWGRIRYASRVAAQPSRVDR